MQTITLDAMKTPSLIAMKTNSILRRITAALLLPLGAFWSAGMLTLNAADAYPPAKMPYQGFLVDGNGAPLASARVQNYDVIFRIYDASQGGTVLWAEQQTVTIDKGNFSVLLGEGTAVGSEPRPSLDTVFGGVNASDRYIGLTVKRLSGTDAEILPRLRLLPAPYAFLARNATSLIGPNGQPLVTTAGGTIQSAGGAPRGQGAVDLQNTRFDNAQVASGNYSVVGGGQNNRATRPNAVVAGGVANSANGENSAIAGGVENVTTGLTAVIGGGFANINNGQDAVIAGGHRNTNSAFVSSIGGGQFNLAGGNASTVAGGFKNRATELNATVGGGAENQSRGITGTIAGGFSNVVASLEGFIGGGAINQVTGDKGAIAGGIDNRVSGLHGAIGGGHLNKAGGINSHVSGGFNNNASGGASGIGGGDNNQASGHGSWIGGGLDNKATADRATIAGGHENTAAGINSFIGAGFKNATSANDSTVGGGAQNRASGDKSVVAGGISNEATGISSAVPGGFANRAQGDHSFAAGRRAKALHHGSFVWADSSFDADFASEADNQFIVRATGGGVVFQVSGAKTPANGGDGRGVFLRKEIGGGTSWGTFSDKNMKKNIVALDGKEVLEKLERVPVNKWHYKSESDSSVPHIGPTAQDFKAAFYPGRDDEKMITTLEFDGVELAAIKGLHELVKEKESEINSLKNELQELRALVQELAKRTSAP